MNDAEPGDIYVDEYGKLWRVKLFCPTPSVTVEEVEPSPDTSAGSRLGFHTPKHEMRGGVGGAMWNGFKRIFRPTPQKHVYPDALAAKEKE